MEDTLKDYYDAVIFGAGFYGLYSALKLGEKGKRVIVIERDAEAFSRASYVNQARIHMGYHYPRSISTAIKSANYFERFCNDYGFCIHKSFKQVYATSSKFSWTNSIEFQRFCKNAKIRCENIDPDNYFNPGMCDGAFLTEEYTYDAQILKRWFFDQFEKYSNVDIEFNCITSNVRRIDNEWVVTTNNGGFTTPFIINASYASINEVIKTVDEDNVGIFKIKYEKCEIILCSVNDKLKDLGVTVMDGPFFSLMPFGRTGLHSLTSVTFTPHDVCYDELASFQCQEHSGGRCKPGDLYNCNDCPAKPESAWPYMSQLARKYLREEYDFHYHSSLFSMKPILMASEIDDSRPTVIRYLSKNPTFVSARWGLTPLRKCYDSYISTMNRVDTFLVCAYNPYNSIYFRRA